MYEIHISRDGQPLITWKGGPEALDEHPDLAVALVRLILESIGGPVESGGHHHHG